ncbi:uncharacterized protein LOC110417098 [Herrania umbratica]|uniref:Uncharacterized protein LOC110417098 n=1 Tax=Herrania umbratica TaxID=108875 RepID=A0A6J1AE91_9ROSI|nr:uncharacterized protein LOC110417098 [Herrania umbratica]
MRNSEHKVGPHKSRNIGSDRNAPATTRLCSRCVLDAPVIAYVQSAITSDFLTARNAPRKSAVPYLQNRASDDETDVAVGTAARQNPRGSIPVEIRVGRRRLPESGHRSSSPGTGFRSNSTKTNATRTDALASSLRCSPRQPSLEIPPGSVKPSSPSFGRRNPAIRQHHCPRPGSPSSPQHAVQGSAGCENHLPHRREIRALQR